MAENDVQVKEIDVIKLYNKKFGDFLASISGHISQLQHVLQEKQDMLQQAMRDIKNEREKVEDEIHHARNKYDDSYNHGTYKTRRNQDGSMSREFIPDYEYIRKCREEKEHLEGYIRHHVKNCAELGHAKQMQANQMIDAIRNRTKKLATDYEIYVSRGRTYLDKVEQYIDQYKENDLDV